MWGKHHWREDTLPKGFASHLRGKVYKIAEELRKEGFLVKRPSSHGYQWHANRLKKSEIDAFVSDVK